MNKARVFATIICAVGLAGSVSPIHSQSPSPAAQVPPAAPVVPFSLPSTYVSAQTPADQLQLNADNTFSLQEAGETYHGTFVVNGTTLRLSISETSTETAATMQSSGLLDSSGRTWVLREPPAHADSVADVVKNQDIIRLVRSGLDDEIVIAKIGSSKCQFDTSPAALIQLRQSGISEAVIKVMAGTSTPPDTGGGATSTLPAATPAVPSQQELALWNSIKDSSDRGRFADYLQRFPNGSYRAIAVRRMASLSEGDRTRAAANVDPGLRVGAAKENPKDGLKYILIPPGTFLMGCSVGDTECKDDEKPAHEVTITKGFWMGQTEVTQEAYQRVVGNNPRGLNGAKLPVGAVSWKEAQRYCQLIGGRLPTEAEWEYSARAATPAARYGNLEDIAWYRDNSVSRAHEAGQKQPNAFGLYDMLGNVAEWVADWYGDYQAGNQHDPGGPASGEYRVARGGTWGFNLRGERASDRIRVGPEARYSDFALRCAASADASFNPPAHLPAAALSIQSEPCQAQINETTADLKGVTGDPDVQSGSIATNPKELAALRLKGERNYTDVKLGRTKQPQRFGVITLKLDSVNPKQGRYTVEIVADDKTIAKKDKHINEPVQFYTATGGHTPYELVIYQINKDGIVGYLSTPKGTAAAAPTADSAPRERIYTEIKLGRTTQPHRFGNIALRLTKVNPETSTYSVEILTDDKMTLVEDKRINDFVQFYTIKSGRTLYNLVINQVTNDGIVGYLWREPLKRMGERNYFDVKLGITKQPQRFADITLKLESADAKHNKYSVLVMADDSQYEKKDKNVNEPVQFYTIKGGQIPYELVINQVTKDGVVGYLSTPKNPGVGASSQAGSADASLNPAAGTSPNPPELAPPNQPSGPTQLTGRVVWNGIPVPNAGVQLKQVGDYSSLPVLASTVSAADGTFTIQEPPTGSLMLYTLAPSADYWGRFGHPVSITTGQPKNIGDLAISKKLQLLSPANQRPNGATVATTTPTLQWTAFPGAVRYEVYVFNNTTQQRVFLQTTQSTQITVAPALQSGQQYQWSVNAYNSGRQEIAYYSAWYFTIQESSAPSATPKTVRMGTCGGIEATASIPQSTLKAMDDAARAGDPDQVVQIARDAQLTVRVSEEGGHVSSYFITNPNNGKCVALRGPTIKN
jgi:formylglycine-generating enzyme required for sulfatase activity